MAETKKNTILIADDEAHIRLLIEQALEDLEETGVEIITAKNGMQALQLIQEIKPKLVFLDVMMPIMNGFDVCRTIKNEPETEDVYIVLITAKGQEFDHQMGEKAGANFYITKPFDPDELLNLATKVMGA
jgi:two-component system, OmpR family, alkaline phosphatase synthesis response regulator PhoP